ncbi:MAG: sensor histidine kinase, partial [Gemmatimonadaceae bacterium]
ELDDNLAAAISAPVLRHALVNLLDNAAKYSPANSVITVGSARHGGCVRIWVDDQGAGVPVADRDRIWEPYVRLPRDVRSSSTGSGIGLSVVRHLAERYDGRAWVEDAPHGGARFVIELVGGTVPTETPAEEEPYTPSPVVYGGY